MATVKSDDIIGTTEYSLSTELLAADHTDEECYQENIVKIKQNLEEPFLTSDVEPNDNFVDCTVSSDNSDDKNKLVELLCSHSSPSFHSEVFSQCIDSNNSPIISNLTSNVVKTTDSNVNLINNEIIAPKSPSIKHCFKISKSAKNKEESKIIPNFNQRITTLRTKDCFRKPAKDGIKIAGDIFMHEKSTENQKHCLLDKVHDRILPPVIYDDVNGYLFQDSTYDSSMTTFETDDDDWEVTINSTCMSLNTDPTRSPMNTHTLFIKQAGTSDTLMDQVTEVIGKSELTALSLETLDVISLTGRHSVIWFHLVYPLNKRATEIMTLLKNTSASVVVVTNKLVTDELPIQADIFTESSLNKDLIKMLCLRLMESINPCISKLSIKKASCIQSSTSSTPESTVSSVSEGVSLSSPIQDSTSPQWCRLEHATKEKQRRERIKDSCDQLRMLLPYVKGRKTDMASILEMTVDYLKIVNSALSQDFHSQVIDVMANGNNSLESDRNFMCMSYKKGIEKEKDNAISSTKPLQTTPKIEVKDTRVSTIKRMVTRSLSRSLVSSEGNQTKSVKVKGKGNAVGIVAKRGLSTGMANFQNVKLENNAAKKPHINPQPDIKPPCQFESSVLFKDRKLENVMEDGSSQSHIYPGIHQFPHLFNDGDMSANQMFAGHLSNNNGFSYFSKSQLNVQSTNNTNDRSDINGYGNVCCDNTLMPYSFSTLQDSNNGNYFGTEYVNPNAVLPVTSYSLPRISSFSSTRKFDRTPSSNINFLQCDASDILNNNSLEN